MSSAAIVATYDEEELLHAVGAKRTSAILTCEIHLKVLSYTRSFTNDVGWLAINLRIASAVIST